MIAITTDVPFADAFSHTSLRPSVQQYQALNPTQVLSALKEMMNNKNKGRVKH